MAKPAEKFAEEARPGDKEFAQAAYAAGLLHDLGKYREEFQEYLDPRNQRQSSSETHHAVYGSTVAFDSGAIRVAFGVAGHHSGLHDLSGLDGLIGSEKYSARDAVPCLVARAKNEIVAWEDAPVDAEPTTEPGKLRFEFSARLFFSILVDSDRLDTAANERRACGIPALPAPLHLYPSGLLAKLEDVRNSRAIAATPGPVNTLRNKVFNSCRAAGKKPQGFFSLTVPTGGGKTLSSMAFALAHAEAHSLRRVIVVIPYLSIIEQNAGEYRKIFGHDQVVEHHSGARPARAGGADPTQVPMSGLAVENWDAPIIVTTSVQFVESLFAASPSRCRKLHNMARSVVILDEVQTLPTHLLEPVLNAFRELRREYGVSFLFCSATQPAFRRSGNLTQGFDATEVTELAPEPDKLFRELVRVRYSAPKIGEDISWDALAARLAKYSQVLCIVNTRRHALQLWQELRRHMGHSDPDLNLAPAGLFHLSASMCAEHRLDGLGISEHPPEDNIKHRLSNGLPCHVISTQLVEAGVDIDFPVVFRAMGPLDSIVQAAGRCNREGSRPLGEVFLFRPADLGVPRGVYSTGTTLAESYIFRDDLATNPHIFSDYFDELFGCLPLDHCAKGERTIQQDRFGFNFRRVAEKAIVIDDAEAEAVVVPYGVGMKRVERIRRSGWFDRDELRGLQRFMVNLRGGDIRRLKAMGVLQPLLPGKVETHVLEERCYRRYLGVFAEGLSPTDFTV